MDQKKKKKHQKKDEGAHFKKKKKKSCFLTNTAPVSRAPSSSLSKKGKSKVNDNKLYFVSMNFMGEVKKSCGDSGRGRRGDSGLRANQRRQEDERTEGQGFSL